MCFEGPVHHSVVTCQGSRGVLSCRGVEHGIIHPRWRLRAHGVWVYAAALVVAVLSFVASSAALHGACHAEATDPGHQCVLTQLAHGQLDVEPPTRVAPPAPAPHGALVPVTRFLLSSPAVLLPPSCGPPAA